jgi:putative methylase
MLLRDLELMLSQIPSHPAPRAELEQYATPADVAAPLLFEARALGDVEARRVVDLGCGTGIFALGAALLGAAVVTGVDVDAASLAVARAEAARLGVDVAFVESDVRAWSGEADTVIMNPPFGAQSRGADRAFLDVAFAAAPVVYSMHNASTRDFVEAYARERGFLASRRWALRFALAHQFAHQSKRSVDVDVLALRLVRDGVSR